MPTILLKRLGKKKIKEIPFELDKQVNTLKALLEACVKSEVKTYNDKKENVRLLPFLTIEEIRQQSTQGKIGFGNSSNNTLANESDAIENVLQSFEDGLFVVFIDDDEIKTLDQTIQLDEQSTISFIRMTFLTGTYW